jgi:hypothetical protein
MQSWFSSWVRPHMCTCKVVYRKFYAFESLHACELLQVPRLLATAPFDSGGQTGRLRTVTALQVRCNARQLTLCQRPTCT